MEPDYGPSNTETVVHLAAGVLDVLRLAMETRKVMLVDIALDLVQKLIAFHHLAGPVHAIAHRRDAASAPRGKHRGEDDDGVEPLAADGPMPPQVGSSICRAHCVVSA